jgi:hypothetical protein
MYVLFEEGSDYACGYSERVKPFTTGIRVDDVSMLTKDIEEEYWVDENKGGLKWYVDKHGMPTTDKRDAKPLIKKITVNDTIDFMHYPNKFNKIDVMKHKQRYMLEHEKFNDCMMYEFNLVDFVDFDKSLNVQANDSEIRLLKDSYVVTTPIKIGDSKEFAIRVDSRDDVEFMFSYDGEHFVKAKKNNKIVDDGIDKLYVKIKNKVNHDNIVYAYQVLLK